MISFVALALSSAAVSQPPPAPPAPAAQTAPAPAEDGAVRVEEVSFRSTDGQSTIKGYLFHPVGTTGRAPAIVMLHGRSGAYSSLANGVYNASTLSSRHRAWGQLLARNGYVALMVDDFGSLGFPTGFARGTYNERPAALDEVTIRPLHAYGALRYLRTRADVDPRHIGLLGWSNGGSATLAAMADDKAGDMRVHGFQAAVSMYPGCGLRNRFRANGYRPYAPVRVFMGLADEEVSPRSCTELVERSRRAGGSIDITTYEGAEHSFDTPIRSRQSVAANAAAKADAEPRILAFFAEQLRPR